MKRTEMFAAIIEERDGHSSGRTRPAPGVARTALAASRLRMTVMGHITHIKSSLDSASMTSVEGRARDV